MFKLFTLLLFAVSQSQCLPQKKLHKQALLPTSSAGNNSSTGKIDAQMLSTPNLVVSVNKIGTHNAMLIKVNSEIRGDYYQYSICSVERKEECRDGIFMWGAKLVPDLAAGKYTVAVKPCIRAEKALHGIECGKEITSYYHQPQNAAGPLQDLINEQLRLSAEIKDYGPLIQKELKAYQEASFGQAPPSSEFDELVANQLRLGPHVSAELVNAPEFNLFYRKLYEEADKPVDKTETKTEPVSADASNYEKQLDELSNRVEQMEKENAELTKEQEKSDKTSTALPVIVSLGSTGVVLGIVTAGLGYAATMGVDAINTNVARVSGSFDQTTKKYISDSFNVVRSIFHHAQGYIDLKSPTELRAEIAGDSSLQEKTIDGKKFYVKDGRIEYFLDGEIIYKTANSLFAVDNLEPGFLQNKALTAEAYRKLSPAFQMDFESRDGGTSWRLKPYLAEQYFVVENKVYKKARPEVIDRFPDLNEETIYKLFQQKAQLKSDPSFHIQLAKDFGVSSINPNTEWAKGVPLIDKQGRLVEPPDAWKVRNKNWFFTPAGSTGVGTFFSNAINGNSPSITVDGKVFYEADTSKLLKIPETIKDNWATGWSFVENSFWNTEVALRMQEIEIERKLRLFDPEIKGKINQATNQGMGYGKYAMIAGAFIAIAGLSASVLGAASLNLSSSVQETLIANLRKIEDAIKKLHAKRLANLQEIKKLLKDKNSEPSSDYWIYQL